MCPTIHIDLGLQHLTLRDHERVVCEYPVSTAANGPGEHINSQCTPRGWHHIHTKIGVDAEPGAVFVGRCLTGEKYTPALGLQYPKRDWILTRILWLGGLEPECNQYGFVDTLSRYIYIHGTPDEVQPGSSGSHGCIRMRNADIIDLFDRVSLDTRVHIQE